MSADIRAEGFAPDTKVATGFLNVAYEPTDWVALFLKSYTDGRVRQRVVPVLTASSDSMQRWLVAMNRCGFNIYVSVNAIASGSRSRTRDAIASVRHLFLDADHDADQVLASVHARDDLPAPSYVLHSSPGRGHLFWRIMEFEAICVERLQKQLARELATDPAATPITQTTRLPGFLNHKYADPHLVTIDYNVPDHRFGPTDFPAVRPAPPAMPPPELRHRTRKASAVARARSYLASVPPAITGDHGDLHTFRVCCRLVRGFALDDEHALDLLSEWNEQCRPPWTTAELADKLRRAARYGREPVGGLL